MNMPYINGLRSEIWAKSTPEQRINSLQELQNHMAYTDGRTPCQVQSGELDPQSRGAHYFDKEGNENITLNSNLVDNPEPYQAAETLLHEDRHSHQNHVVSHPELAENETQLQDWSISNKGGYIQPDELNYSTYRMQPTEIDANQAARANTDALYQETFQDTDSYPKYKIGKEQEISDSIEYAKVELGEDYEEEARQAVVSKYEALMEQAPEESQGIYYYPYQLSC